MIVTVSHDDIPDSLSRPVVGLLLVNVSPHLGRKNKDH